MMKGGGTTETSTSDDAPEIFSSGGDITQCAELPTIDPDDLVGYKFVREFNGTQQQSKSSYMDNESSLSSSSMEEKSS